MGNKAKLLKEKFDTGNYLCLHKVYFEQEDADKWILILSPTFEYDEDEYRLVNTKDKDIIEAILEQPDVAIEMEMWFRDDEDSLPYQDWGRLVIPFIEHYGEHINYRLKREKQAV